MSHEEISKVSECPCNFEGTPHKRGRGDLASPESIDGHAHTHDHAHAHDHVHDGRPHVHLPDGTIRYLEEGELPSAPKRRRSASE